MLKLNVYDTALMLAGQFCLVHFHNENIQEGTVVVIPDGPQSGVYMNPKDAPARGPILLPLAAPKKPRRR
jgi:hypothetical protein